MVRMRIIEDVHRILRPYRARIKPSIHSSFVFSKRQDGCRDQSKKESRGRGRKFTTGNVFFYFRTVRVPNFGKDFP